MRIYAYFILFQFFFLIFKKNHWKLFQGRAGQILILETKVKIKINDFT